MSLILAESSMQAEGSAEAGCFELQGEVVFDNASAVEQQGRDLLLKTLKGCDRWVISLHGVGHADSSALSVCLSWLRLAREKGVSLCFTGIPDDLEALAQVCGINELLANVTCPATGI